MRLTFALFALALIVSALSGVGLAWDGSFTLFASLDPQTPNTFYGRWTQVPLHWLVLQVSHLTSDTTIIAIAFTAVYAVLTLATLAASWWVVGDAARPLFVWAALGIGLAALPGQVCYVCQAVTAVQLFFPLLLAILVGMPRRTIPLVALLSVAIFFFHPVAIPLFGIAAGCALLIALRYRERRGLLVWAALFALVAAAAEVRFLVFESSYESDQLSLPVIAARFHESVQGMPLAALACASFAALTILVAPRIRRAHFGLAPRLLRRAAAGLALAGLALAGEFLLIWAGDSHLWMQAVNYRAWVLFAALPFMALALLDVLWRGPAADRRLRLRAGQAVAVVFFVVLSVQSFGWHYLTQHLLATMAASPSTCLNSSSIKWLYQTPLDHWSVSTNSLLLQGRTPTHVVLNGDACQTVSFLEAMPVAIFGPKEWRLRDWQTGWFDFHVLRDQLVTQQETPPSCQYPFTSGWFGIEEDNGDWWRWTSGRASVRLFIAQDTPALVRGAIVSIRQPNQVDIAVNGDKIETFSILKDGFQPFTPIALTLRRGENTIEFTSHNPPVQIPTDSRWLAVAIRDLQVTLSDGTTLCR